MKKEDIEKAAVDSCVFENSIFNPQLTPYYRQGFMDGAQWRINSVWHDREVIPEFIEKELLIMFCDNSCMIISIASHWRDFLENNKFVKWAYLEDLMPIISTEI